MATTHAAKRGSSNLTVPPEKLEEIYTTMRRIRAFEERTAELFQEGLVKGTAHSYVGEEAIASAVGSILRDDDYMASNHRGHGHCIAKGAKLDRMMAELMGRDTGYCHGLGGSMHIADMNLNILGANGIVGAAMPLSTGTALAAKLRGTDQVVVAFFGDGGSNQGIFHESLNLASVWKLPVLFICENNQYALSTSYKRTTSAAQISDRAIGYQVPGVTIDGNDPEEVYNVVEEAVARARAGEGPTLIECLTYRWGQHSLRANLNDPRPEKELEEWIARDPMKVIEKALIDNKVATRKRLNEIGKAVETELEEAVTYGKDSPEPNVAMMEAAVYSPHATYTEPGPNTDRELSFPEALNEALAQEMARDDSVFVMGEDVGETGGIFTVTKGLIDKFGEERVRDTPISEATFVGCGVGAAIAGMRPVVEIQIFDFIALTMDMLVNQAAKFRYMLGGGPTVPLVVRGPQGGGIRMAAQHSQSLEAWFTHVPGLVVVAPSTPYDAKGLLVSAIRDDNPVIFLETKLAYVGSGGPVPEELYAIPIGKADVKREGADVTVLATMAMVPRALTAATQLAREGIDVEVVDPRTLRPLDEETILESVRKTNRLVIVHEAWQKGGFGAEVSALVVENAFDYLDAPIQRVGARDVPMPYNDGLEVEVIPSIDRIANAIRDVMR
jgi:2-oxoisovalerate dehydrogenase E1 component